MTAASSRIGVSMRLSILVWGGVTISSLLLRVAGSASAMAGEAEISPEEVYSRIHRTSVSDFRNAVGYYIVRTFDSKGTQKNKDTIESLERSLEESVKARVENDKKYGIATDVMKLRAENQAVLEAAKLKHSSDSTTRIERYVVQGGNFRIERIPVSNSDPLEKILQEVLAKQIDLSKPEILTWNGSVTAEIYRSTPGSGKKGESYSSISYRRLTDSPDFMSFGRDAKDGDFLAKFTKEKLPFSTEAVTVGNEAGILLRIGDKRTVGALIEIVALPEKGYAITSGKVKSAGAILAEDKYSAFVQASNGSWLPTHIVRSNYRLTKQGVPFLATKREYLAIEPPEVNVELPTGVFDLADTKEFASVRAAWLTERRATPQLDPNAVAKGGVNKWLFANIAVLLALLGIFFFRRIQRKRLRGVR